MNTELIHLQGVFGYKILCMMSNHDTFPFFPFPYKYLNEDLKLYMIPTTGSLDSGCESLWKKMIGKPYSGKLNVRFEEGELEIGHVLVNVALTDERGRNR
ncbi:MAG: hypothetical protein JYX80_14590 [Candidatus Scalindua sediminis]|nr:hypothetical protein [Candidatus Scalindua sediminis]